MRIVHPGETVTFENSYSQGLIFDPYDADIPYDSDFPYENLDVIVSITKDASTYLAGPFRYSSGDIQRDIVGTFFFTYTFSQFITPGIYQVKWETLTDELTSIYIETFAVEEIAPLVNNILDAPTRYGIMLESSLYRIMGVGDTDRLFLVGHADGLVENEPYQVVNMTEALNLIGAGQSSPMVRALLEAYNSGARDIWLVSCAPEGEYVPFDATTPDTRFATEPAWGNKNFYERYYERLEECYGLLQEHDTPEIIVPVEASAYNTGDVDFVQQLVDHCYNSYLGTSLPRIGMIGTRVGNFSSQTILDIVNDDKFNIDYGEGGKFVVICHGEATYSLKQMNVAHTSPVVVSAAATLAVSSLDRGITYRNLPAVLTPYGRELTVAEHRMLSAKKVNPLIRTAKGRRGGQYQAVMATDNTLSSEGSDYWSVCQMRLVTKVLQKISSLGTRYLGTIGFPQFREDVRSYLSSLVVSGNIRDYDVRIERDKIDLYTANVEVNLTPFFGVRELAFIVQVGPGA